LKFDSAIKVIIEVMTEIYTKQYRKCYMTVMENKIYWYY